MPRDNLSYDLYQQPGVHLCSAWQQLPVQPALPGTRSSHHRQPQHPPADLHPLSLPHPFLHHHPKGWEAAWKAGGTYLPKRSEINSTTPREIRYRE